MLTKSTFVSCVQKRFEGLEQSLENVRKIALARREVTGVIAKITLRMEGTLPTLGISHHSERSANGLRFWERKDPGLYFCSKITLLLVPRNHKAMVFIPSFLQATAPGSTHGKVGHNMSFNNHSYYYY